MGIGFYLNELIYVSKKCMDSDREFIIEKDIGPVPIFKKH